MALESETLYKLIVLYMLDRVDFPLSNSMLTGYINESGLTDYPTLLEILAVLQNDGLIHVDEADGNTRYTLTPQGADMLQYFANMISDEIKSDIKAYLKQNEYELKQAANVTAEYYPTNGDDFAVHCSVREHNASLIDMTVTVPDEEVADHMCSRWKMKNAEIYEYIMQALISES